MYLYLNYIYSLLVYITKSLLVYHCLRRWFNVKLNVQQRTSSMTFPVKNRNRIILNLFKRKVFILYKDNNFKKRLSLCSSDSFKIYEQPFVAGHRTFSYGVLT